MYSVHWLPWVLRTNKGFFENFEDLLMNFVDFVDVGCRATGAQ